MRTSKHRRKHPKTRKTERALGAPMTITQKELVQSYGNWILAYLSFPHQEDLITHLHRRNSTCPHATMEQAYKWTGEYLSLEWEAYFLTFLFRHIPGPVQEKIRQMHKDISSFYGKLASWVVRDPKSPKIAHLLPRAVFLPDGPCYTGRKKGLREVTINDGLHFHGILLVPTRSRLKVPFLQHLREKKRIYNRRNILMYYAEPIRDHHRFVADYAGKAVKRGRVSYDDVLILPRTGAEMSRDRVENISGPDREIEDIMSANNLSLETVRGLCQTSGNRDKTMRR
jgi:hypothetical protein